LNGLVVHAPTIPALDRACRNLQNMLKCEPETRIELVVNGEAVKAAIEIGDPQLCQRLVLCENSIAAQELTPPQGLTTTTAAVFFRA